MKTTYKDGLNASHRHLGETSKTWERREITEKTNIEIYETMIKPVRIRTLLKQDKKRILAAAAMSWQHNIAGILKLQKIRKLLLTALGSS